MNQSKFSLADLLTVLASIGFGFFCFLSFNFLTMGETKKSILFAIAFALILGGLAYGAKLLKRTDRNFKTCLICEWVFLLLFVVVAIFAIKPFSHYFVVSSQKDEIQKEVIANIEQAEEMYNDYKKYADNRLMIYESKLNSVVMAKRTNPSEYKEYGFEEGTEDKTQVENKLFTLKAKLYPSNYDDVALANVEWMKTAKSTVNGWKPIGLVDVIKAVKENLTNWKNDLTQYSEFRADGEVAEDFDHPLSFNDVTGKMTQLSGTNWVAILFAIVLYIIMLFSYFITKPHWSYPGFIFLFKKIKVRFPWKNNGNGGSIVL